MPAARRGLADEFARLDARGLRLIEEADPRTTVELLPDWERLCGLPDPAIPPPIGTAARRAAIASRLVSVAGQSTADYIDVVALFGYAATITVPTPFAADVSAADDALYDTASRFWWIVNVTVPTGTATPIVLLEHAIKRQAQIHTYVTFNYLFD